MRWSELRAAVAGAVPLGDRSGGADADVTAVTLDSREVRPGGVFVAAAGTNRDGHAFVREALERGAAALALERPVPEAADRPAILVPDGRRAAGLLASRLHGDPTARLAVTGITGTNGKTTTAFFLREMLEAAGEPAALLGTIVYDTGRHARPAPLTTPDPAGLQALFAEALEAGRRHAVMEVSSHALAQGRVEGTRFRVGLLTNVTRDHLDFHGTPEAYRAAKGLLFSGLAAGATAVLNADDPASAAYARETRGRTLLYGAGPRCDVRLARIAAVRTGTAVRLETPLGPIEAETRMLGRVNGWNAAAAAAAGVALGLSARAIADGVARLAGVPGRLERAGVARGVEALVDFAHTPAALAGALASVREVARGRVLVVFGCGGDRDRGKRPEMGATAERLADRVYATSDNPRSEDPEAILDEVCAGFSREALGSRVVREPDRAAAIRRAVADARPGDVVLVAGKGHETEQIVGSARLPFDDREEARAALAGRVPRSGR